MGSESNWTAPLVSYLKNEVLPDEKEAARKLKVQAARFVLIRDVLYKRGFSRPYLRCLGTEKVDYVMREVHEGICGNHSVKVISAQAYASRVLLAHHAEGCQGLCKDLRQMPKVQQYCSITN